MCPLSLFCFRRGWQFCQSSLNGALSWICWASSSPSPDIQNSMSWDPPSSGLIVKRPVFYKRLWASPEVLTCVQKNKQTLSLVLVSIQLRDHPLSPEGDVLNLMCSLCRVGVHWLIVKIFPAHTQIIVHWIPGAGIGNGGGCLLCFLIVPSKILWLIHGISLCINWSSLFRHV